MRSILLLFLTLATFSVQAEIYKETHLIEDIGLSRKDPDYDGDVRYNLHFEGLQTYKVTLQTWKFVYEEDFPYGKRLRLQKEEVLFKDMKVDFELGNRDPFSNDFVSIKSISGKSNEGEMSFVRPPGNGAPPDGFYRFSLSGKAMKHLFPKASVEKKVFYQHGGFFSSLSSLNQCYGKFAPALQEIKHVTREVSDGYDGSWTEHFTTAIVYGNEVHSFRDCEGTTDITDNKFELSRLARQGFTGLILNGSNKDRCIKLFDKNGKELLKVML